MLWRPKLPKWLSDWGDAQPPALSTTERAAPSASVAHAVAHGVAHAGPPTTQDQQLDKVLHEHIAHSILVSKALERERARAEENLRAMGIEIEAPSLRQQRKKKAKAPVSKAAKRSARWRAKNREEYLRRHREEEAARRAKQKAEKVAAAQAVAAGVVDLGAVRAQRRAEAPQVVEQIEQQVQRALPD